MEKLDRSKVVVVTPLMNPVRYQSRYRLFDEWLERMLKTGVTIIVVEVAFGDRPFVARDLPAPHRVVRLRTWHELWQKEAMLNIGIAHARDDYQMLGWVDADVEFTRDDWPDEVWNQLQHYMVVQPFSHAVDLGPNGEIMQTHNGFAWSYLNGKPWGKHYGFWHPGYAWFYRREFVEEMSTAFSSTFMDHAILGAGDHHAALAMIGQVDRSIPKWLDSGGLSSNYYKWCKRWEHRALRVGRRDLGYVAGHLKHYWHGRKVSRYYPERWRILESYRFDPEIDLQRDRHGLWELVVETDRQVNLRDDIRAYFRARNEDEVTTGEQVFVRAFQR